MGKRLTAMAGASRAADAQNVPPSAPFIYEHTVTTAVFLWTILGLPRCIRTGRNRGPSALVSFAHENRRPSGWTVEAGRVRIGPGTGGRCGAWPSGAEDASGQWPRNARTVPGSLFPLRRSSGFPVM